jgi:hypothetical protein
MFKRTFTTTGIETLKPDSDSGEIERQGVVVESTLE